MSYPTKCTVYYGVKLVNLQMLRTKSGLECGEKFVLCMIINSYQDELNTLVADAEFNNNKRSVIYRSFSRTLDDFI